MDMFKKKQPHDIQRTQEPLTVNDILDRAIEAHQAYFDIERPYLFAGRHFAAYAQFHSETSQYVLVKRAKLWSATSHEHIFFDTRDQLDANTLSDMLDFMTSDALSKVEPNSEHMSTYVTLIDIAQNIDESATNIVRKARFRKNFKFGLNGWADLKVVAINASQCDIVSNGCGKDLAATLFQQLGWNKR